MTRKQRLSWTSALIAIGFATTMACTARPEPGVDERTDARSDAAITTSIQAEYFQDDSVKALSVDVDTEDGVVTLSGSVESEAAKARAVDIARQVEGVTRVEDRLTVRAETMAEQTTQDPTRPATQRDVREPERDADQVNTGWITTKIQAQYFLDPDVKGREIDVTTRSDGSVTLRGEVENAEAHRKAVELAQSTEGVTRVVDELQTAPAPEAVARTEPEREPEAERGVGETLSDAWITAKIQSRFFLDAEVKGRRINVDTANGIVTLTGEVERAAERRQAVQLARNTEGVVDVRDQLSMTAPEPETEETAEPGEAGGDLSDVWVTTKIQSKYFMDDDLSARDIDVTTRDGVVILEGRVQTAEEKRVAEVIANETRGVRRVDNRIQVVAVPDGDGR